MEKAKISVIQLFSMMVFFELGSALVVSLGIGAGKDAWLAILLGMCGGVILFFMYYLLFRQYPNLPLTAYAREAFGTYIGWGIGLLYILYFLYSASRNLRDFGDLLLTSTLQHTPLLVINLLMILTICYVIYLGMEVLGRTAEVLSVIFLFLGGIGTLFIFISGDIDIKHIRPFLENGWMPILKTAFPTTTYFPFAELLVFMMLLPFLNQPEMVKRVWLSALIVSGLILSCISMLNISVLGVEEMRRATFPLLSTIGKVNLLGFLQRLDAIVVYAFLITMFFKTAIFFYSAVIGIVDLFKLKTHRRIILPIGIVLLFWSEFIASNFAEHIQEGLQIAPYLFFIPMYIALPLFMLILAKMKHRRKNKANQ